MKIIKFILFLSFFTIHITVKGNIDSSRTEQRLFGEQLLTIEPALGLKPGPTSPTPGVVISSLAQWNFSKRLSLNSYTAFTFNNAFMRNFNYINTDYSYSLNQKFGAGVSLYTKHSSHTFSLMAGIIYDAFKETLNNPEFETISVSDNRISPDFGLMYSLKVGRHKYFFSYRMYIPLYPYPFKTTDINAIDGNISNVTLEFGLGIRLK